MEGTLLTVLLGRGDPSGGDFAGFSNSHDIADERIQDQDSCNNGFHQDHRGQPGNRVAQVGQAGHRLLGGNGGNDHGEGKGRVAGEEGKLQKAGQAAQDNDVHQGGGGQHPPHHRRALGGDRLDIAGQAEADGGGVDAEEGLGRILLDRELHIAHSDKDQQDNQADEAEPKGPGTHSPRFVKGRGGQAGHHDTHIDDEVAGEDLGEIQFYHEFDREPDDQRDMERNAQIPDDLGRGSADIGLGVDRQQHGRHGEGTGDAGHHRVLHGLADALPAEDRLQHQAQPQHRGQGAEYEADALAVALQQIAQGGQAQHNAGNGDGQGFQKVFHTLIPRQCF